MAERDCPSVIIFTKNKKSRTPRIVVTADKVTYAHTQTRQLRGTHADSLPLLPSGPDGVYKGALHETRPST